MVFIKKHFLYLPNGDIDIESWLNTIRAHFDLERIDRIQKATDFALHYSKGLTLFYGQTYVEQGLEMAEILLELKLDQDAVAAAIISSTLQATEVPHDTLTHQLGESITQLALNALQLNSLNHIHKTHNQTQIDRLRKTFLAMVSDIRVVIIKLAERTCVIRGIKNINLDERNRIAQETLDIFAPLANRLGIWQLKWELEDTAFRYTQPDTYKMIASFLAERRSDREKRIHDVITQLNQAFTQSHIQATIYGRAKHIYSIYLKAKRKHLHYQAIFDYSAIRVLVPSITDCYTVLSIVHSLFDHIPAEFDDYISKPKANGYRSIHTAVINDRGQHFEIQIRTHDMHEKAEHGMAAHWIYKEKKLQPLDYEAKITLLRQLLSWHKDPSLQESPLDHSIEEVLKDRVYAFTPAGEIIDLPLGATPLDFAYHVHTQLGHTCRGAKINGNIVSLTYHLRTGDQVEILSMQNGTPSRDWLDKTCRYLKTSRARSKVLHWFKQQEIAQYIESGKNQLERELAKCGLTHISFEKIAARFHCKNDEALFAAIGHGNLRLGQIIHTFSSTHKSETPAKTPAVNPLAKTYPVDQSIKIAGIHDLLTRIAKCCKPIPGDALIGYITQGRGVSIHRQDCSNIINRYSSEDNRFVNVNWDGNQAGQYYVDLQIQGLGQALLKDIPVLLTHLNIDLIRLNSTLNKNNHRLYIALTIQIHEKDQLKLLLSEMNRLPDIISVHRPNE